ncbi:phosphoribosylanthranilate isomerase [Chelatococcus sp. SYSU_G07232]|uniref:N-(5'-phosphoribosyl)anthranilate isomerase n=1 Tax=Chelatococcus albus TaxID=3047466 RepID=A0ABT7AHM0_9HYPH|nr:phosphoribosylanthranilate isomerase [Chelatococcus sp. SYSU_G07232]MDJ1158886.1 phosphoribosylanthranilate isomerase [Chelatococcus sp. SYSU_G07232]
MSLLVKICGLNTAEAVDAALDAGADLIGLVFFPKSPRHVDLQAARMLAARARERAEVVALTVDADDATLGDIVEAVHPDWLQLHGRETPDRVAAIGAVHGIPVMKAVGIATAEDVAVVHSYMVAADRLLLDAKPPPGGELPGGNGLPFDWRLVAGLDLEKPFMLSGGLRPENVAEAIRLVGTSASFAGVDVSSGVESAPGQKDPERIRAFVAAVRAADAARGETRKGRVA